MQLLTFQTTSERGHLIGEPVTKSEDIVLSGPGPDKKSSLPVTGNWTTNHNIAQSLPQKNQAVCVNHADFSKVVRNSTHEKIG